MFQNISEEYKEEYYKSERKINNTKSTIIDLIKQTFTVQNLIFYIGIFMLSMAGINNSIYPFGLAMIASIASNKIPVGLGFVLSAIGTYIGFGNGGLITYLLTMLIFIAFILIFKPENIEEERNEKRKLGKYLLISCLIVQIGKVFFSEILVFNLLEAFVFSITAYIFYKIFSNSINVIKEFGIKRVFTVEEILGASLFIAIAMSSIGELAIWGFSIRNILCILLVLILGWKNGILIGATSGITIGLVLGIIGIGQPILIATFGLSGMIAGILNRFGKIGVIVGFLLGNAILMYFSNGNTQIILHVREILIASLGLLLIPKNIQISIEDLIGKNKYLPVTKEKMLEENKDTVYKLNDVSETISQIAQTYDSNIEEVEIKQEFINENREKFKEELLNVIESYTDNILYDDIVTQETNILNELFEILVEKGKIDEKDIISVFEKHNNFIIGLEENPIIKEDIVQMIKSINDAYTVNNLNFIWQKKIKQSRKNISEELKGVSKVISSLAIDISKKTEDKFKKEKTEIRKLLEQRDMYLKDINIKQEKNKKYIIDLYIEAKENSADNVKTIEKMLTKVFNQEIVLYKSKIKEDEETCIETYTSKDKLSMKFGIAKTKKNKSAVSGDCYTQLKLDDGKYLVAISDGMGSGPEAKKCSSVAIKMLERLLKAGFDRDTSLGLINSTMILNSNEEMYATLDIAILDLYAKNIEFIKNGACATFIKNNENIDIIEAISLPTGILENIDLVVYDKDLSSGDLIIMCSDGILDSNKTDSNKKEWLKNILSKISTTSVKKIADIILTEAIDNGCGIAKDDMTVIVISIT